MSILAAATFISHGGRRCLLGPGSCNSSRPRGAVPGEINRGANPYSTVDDNSHRPGFLGPLELRAQREAPGYSGGLEHSPLPSPPASILQLQPEWPCLPCSLPKRSTSVVLSSQTVWRLKRQLREPYLGTLDQRGSQARVVPGATLGAGSGNMVICRAFADHLFRALFRSPIGTADWRLPNAATAASAPDCGAKP
jgi:hypothetical protein